MAEQNFSAETNTQTAAPAPVETQPAPSTSTSSSDSGKSEMDSAFDDAWAKRGRETKPKSDGGKARGSEGEGTGAKPSAGDAPQPTKDTSPSARGGSGESAKGTGADQQSDAERRARNRQQAAMRIARKQERQRLYQEELDRLNKEKEAFEQEGESNDPTMAAVKEDQIKELQIQMVREMQDEWNREAREMFTSEDAESFLADSKTYADWINKNEPELRQYINKPYGRYLLKGWFDQVAKVPENADRWEAMNPYQKYQMLERNYKQLEKFGEDYAAGKVQIGVQQTKDEPSAVEQPAPAKPEVRDVPLPGSGRNTNNIPPSDNFGLMLMEAENKRKK